MKKLLSKKTINALIFLTSLVYFISYLTRINYAAMLLEIVKTQNVTKAVASMALTASAITYAIGQIISGFLGDKIKPQLLIFIGLFTAATMNILIFFAKSMSVITIVWGINGFAQAMLWPPLVRILSEMLTTEAYKKACVNVSVASSAATIFVYLISPFFITFLNWRSLFLTSAVCGFVTAFFWIKAISFLEKKRENYKPESISFGSIENEKKKIPKNVIVLLCFVMLAIAMQGILRDGITNWMPTYISETFNLGSAISILTGIVLPIFAIVCFKLTAYINKSFLKNELTCATAIFAVGAVSAFLLYFNASFNAIFSVTLSALITGAMHGVNLMLITMLPPYFAKYGKVSFVSGLLNSFTYVGSSVSTYGVALISDYFGWGMTTLSWGIVALAGTALCAVCIPSKKLLE